MRRLLMSYVPAICNILLLGCLLGINHLYLHFLSLQLFLENLDFTSRTNLKLKTRTSLVSILFYLVMPWTSNRLSFIFQKLFITLLYWSARIKRWRTNFWITNTMQHVVSLKSMFLNSSMLLKPSWATLNPAKIGKGTQAGSIRSNIIL